MSMKTVGAIMIILGCGGCGFLTALSYKREISQLKALEEALCWMISELEFRQTALPALLREASSRCAGRISAFFELLSGELDAQIAPDAPSCVEAVLAKLQVQDGVVTQKLRKLGRTLGEFDLQGQLDSLRSVVADCRNDLMKLETDRPQRVRSYQTLGLCAGAALAILFV